MDLKLLKFKILNGSIARRVLLRGFMITLALSVIPLLQMLSGYGPVTRNAVSYNDCDLESGNANPYLIFDRIFYPIWGSFESMQCKETANLTSNVVRELMGMQMLTNDAKALCVDRGSTSSMHALRELGFSNVCGVHRHPFFSLKHKKFVYELDYEGNTFDFVFTRDLDKVSVPALLILEMERVLKPSGIGAVLVGVSGSTPNSLIRSATPVSSILKSSTIVHLDYVNDFTLIVFKKGVEESVVAPYFEQNRLPADCQSLRNNEPFMKFLEPLMEAKPNDYEKKIAYLPRFVDIGSRKRLVYIDIGAGEHLQSSAATDWFLPYYPVDHKAFSIYFVDHNTSVLLSYVKKPGVTFVYHPDLAGTKTFTADPGDSEDLDPSVEDEGFDFLSWFKETVQYADFVVLKMNVGETEQRFLSELFSSGAICFVDELFLRCSDHVDGKGAAGRSCMELFKGLRSSGVFVHQWWEE